MDDLAKVMEAKDGESLEQVRERFKRWRETRGRGEHVARELWVAAVSDRFCPACEWPVKYRAACCP
jgi:hypothetical protein